MLASMEAQAAELQADSIPPPAHPSTEENDEEEVDEGKDEGLTLLEVLDGVSPAKDDLMYATAHAQQAAEQARAAPADASAAAAAPAAAHPPLAARDWPGHGRGSRAKSKKQSAVLPSPATSTRPSVSSTLTSHVDSSSEPPPSMPPSPFMSRLQLPSSSPDATVAVEHAGASSVPVLALPLSLGHVRDVPVKESDSSQAESSRSDSSGARASAYVSAGGDDDDDDVPNGNACGKCVSCLDKIRFGGQGKIRKACFTIFGQDPKGPSDARGSKRSKAMSMERETQALLFDVVSSKLVGALPDGRASRRAKATAAAAAERASLFPTVSLTDLFCYDTLPLQLPQPQEQLRGGTSEPAAVLEKKAARKVIKTSPADVVDKEAAKEAKATGKAAKVRSKAASKKAKADQATAAIAVEAEQLDAKASIDARPHLATHCVSQASQGSAERHIRGTPSLRAFPDRVDNELPRIAEPPLPSPLTPLQVNTPSSMTPMPSLEPLAPPARPPWAPPPMRSNDLLRLFEEESSPSAVSACTGVSTSTVLPFASPPLAAAGSAIEVFAEAVTRAISCSDWAVSAAAVCSPSGRAAVATAAPDACAVSPLFSEALGLSPALSEILRHGDVLEDEATFQQLESAVAARLLERELQGPRPSTLSAQRNLEVELHGLLPSAEDVEALALEAERPEDGDEDRDEDDEEMDRSGDARAREAASCELKGHPLPKHNQAEKKRERREKSRTSTKAQRSLENAALPLPAVPLGEPLTGSLEAAAVAKPPELPPLLKSARKSLSKSRSTLLAPQLPCPKCAKPFDHHKNVAARNSHIKSCLLSEQPPKRHKKGTELVTALEAVLTTALEEVKEEATTASLRAHVTTEASMDGQAKQETVEAGSAADAATNPSIPMGVECDADASADELIGAAKSDGADAGGGEEVGTSEDMEDEGVIEDEDDDVEDEDMVDEGEGMEDEDQDVGIDDEEDGEGQEHAKEHASSWLDSEETREQLEPQLG